MRAKLLAVLLTFFIFPAGMAYAQSVGRVLLAAGEVTASRGTATIKLITGSQIQDKDVLRTGATSNLQVRFTDDSMVSLRENSELRVEEFRFNSKEDGSERAFFSLVKGGLRAFTGLVGRSNNNNYRMSTNTATVGIRGTDYVVTLCVQGSCRNADGSAAKDGLYGRVLGASHGTNRVNVKNDVNEREFGINENFYVADNKSLIQPLLVPPEFLSGKLEGRSRGGTAITGRAGNDQNETNGTQQDSRISSVPPLTTGLAFAAPETASADGTPYTPLVLTPLHSSSSSSSTTSSAPTLGIVGVWSSFVTSFNTFASSGAFVTSAMLTLDGFNDVTAVNIPLGTTTFPTSLRIINGAANASLLDTGGDPAVNANWGRWPGGSSITENSVTSTTPGGAHFLFGDLAPPGVIAAKTGSFLLTTLGGTTPTNNLNLTASAFTYPTINLNFTAQTGTLSGFSWTFAGSGDVWTLNSTTAGVISVTAGQGASFGVNGTGNCSGTNCGTQAVTYRVNGVFLGALGNYLGVGVGMQTLSGNSSAQGVRLYTCAPSC